MKRKLNMLLALSLLGLTGAAYATTCYLNQVVLCFKNGDKVQGSYLHTGSSIGGGTASFYADIFAEESAWRYDKYSVTRGGRTPNRSYTSFCVGFEAGGADLFTQPAVNGGFHVTFWNPLTSHTDDGWNGSGGLSPIPAYDERVYYSVGASYSDTSSTSCN